MSEERKAVLAVEHGSFAYRGSRKILDDINFEVRAGEVMAILGPNGAGKTTLLRCMTDMLRWHEGCSLLYGEDIHSMPARKLWRRMSYVPQARSAASSYTVLQSVLLGRSSRIGAFSAPSDEDVEAAESVLAMLGIAGLADKACSEISGGEFQMVLIARAMASEPEVLVLDEPESNLDFRNQLVVLDTISELASRGVACIFNTHYPAHALQRADRSLILCKDGTSFSGPTSRIVTEDNIRRAFGVNAVIGEVETPESIFRNVVPLSLADEAAAAPDQDEADRGCIASVTIISQGNEEAAKINALLHEYNDLLVGRMGLPHRKAGLYIINTTLDGPRRDIEELSHRLSLLPGLSVKTTYAKEK